MSEFMKDLLNSDRNLIWHPYSQHGLNRPILPVVSAKGAYLKLADGRDILDAISSWWVNIHGHSHPQICKAIEKQASHLEHVIFAGFTHEPAVQLAELLTGYPSIQKLGLSKVFYSDNGSTAVEAALKIAYQFHINRKSAGRDRFLALSQSYHGDTLGAMAVGEPSGFHSQFRPLMPQVDFVEPGNLPQLESILESHGNSYAAFIFEPLVQAAGGMRMYSPTYLEAAVELCRSKGILTISDEVFTGFYRTGKCFAFEHANIRFDLMCLSKGITGGFLPLAVTLATEEVYAAFFSKDIRTAFLHGHSYTANPIACAAAVESWKMLESPQCRARVEEISQVTHQNIEKLSKHPRVRSARSLGTIGAIELDMNVNYFSMDSGTVMKIALDRNVLLRPLGNVIAAVPPYCCTPQEITRIYETMRDILDFIDMN